MRTTLQSAHTEITGVGKALRVRQGVAQPLRGQHVPVNEVGAAADVDERSLVRGGTVTVAGGQAVGPQNLIHSPGPYKAGVGPVHHDAVRRVGQQHRMYDY